MFSKFVTKKKSKADAVKVEALLGSDPVADAVVEPELNLVDNGPDENSLLLSDKVLEAKVPATPAAD